MKEYELPPLEEDTQKRIMKYFAGAVCSSMEKNMSCWNIHVSCNVNFCIRYGIAETEE
jgi:hypothetical protein